MEPVDLEKLIGELEIALDRLRGLYDQYFVGLEKIVPGVLRKDVDRRFYVLRKEQIRNTALRFRFQMVLQRYNTYQTYWQRICREIENGTYKRHLMRAERRFGSARPGPRSVPPPAVEPLGPAAPAVPRDLVALPTGLDRDFAPSSFDVDILMDEEGPAEGRPLPHIVPVAPASLDRPPAPAPKAVPSVWKKVPPAPGGGPAVPAGPPRPPAPAGIPIVPAPAVSARAPAPAVSAATRGPAPAPAVSAPAPAPAASALAPGSAPAVSARAPLPVPAVSAPPPMVPPRPAAPRPTPTVKPPSPPAPADLPEARLREIYAEYVGAKRSQNESTAAITFQAVAKSLRESGDKLRKKHGKPVDFEVAVKDGKTILRPVLK